MSDAAAPVLVTGGAGLIGSAVSEVLGALGRRVHCFDLRDEGRVDWAAHPSLDFVRGDVTDESAVDAWVRRCGLVVHLAAVVGVDEYIQRPEDVLDVNVLGGRVVLRACQRHGVPVLAASSSEVYGKNDEPLREGSDTVLGDASNGRWCYAVSKLVTEHYARALGHAGLRFALVRYFNVYGPRGEAPGRGRVVSKFLGCLRDGRPLPLVDGGAAVRSFCYIDDAAEATARLALALEADAPVRGRVFNVGREEPVTIAELARAMIRLSGHAQGVVHVDGEAFFGPGFEEIPTRVPDTTALREAIGFRAETSLDEGLRRTLAPWGLLRADAEPAPEATVLPTVRPRFEPSAALLATIRRTLDSGRVTSNGPEVQRFEREAAAWLGVHDAVALASGTAGLSLSARVLCRPGKVILPAFTFIATLGGFAAQGLEPVFCDIDPHTWTLCPVHLASLLARESGVSAVVPVNVFGVPPDLAAIAALARAAGAALIYDNCHGFGSDVGGRRIPEEPAAQAFSLHATKLVSSAEGGLLVSSDAAFLAEVRRLRAHGVRPDVYASEPGFNAKLDELRAAVGRHSLAGLDEALARRRGYAARLRGHLARDCDGQYGLQAIPQGVTSNGQMFGVRCRAAERRGIDAVCAEFRRWGVEAMRYFHPPLHQLERYRGSCVLPVTEALCESLVCLPLHSRMRDEDLARVEHAASQVARM